MRPLEALISLLLAIYLLWPLLSDKWTTRQDAALPVLAAIFVGAHLVLEGYRWQMIPLIIMTSILMLIALPKLFQSDMGETNRQRWNATVRIGSLILLAVSTALPVLLPVPNFSAPGGSYSVGTQILSLTDNSRRELYSGKNESRRFMLQVWYPASPGPEPQPAPWMHEAPTFAREISNYLGFPSFFLDHLDLVKTPAFLGAQLKPSRDGYPLLLFSHGWNGFAAQNSAQAIELASHGYVVAAIQHTYGAVVTVFPDGEVAHNNPNALPDEVPDADYDEAARLIATQWSGDLAFALDFLGEEAASQDSPFYQSLDLEAIGIFGHSTGAGAAVQFCGTDVRCKAVLGMDPFMTPVSEGVLENGITQPALFMFSQVWIDDVDSKNNRLFGEFYKNLDPTTQVVGIQGTAHYDFSDLPMLSPIAPQLGLKGPLNGERVTEIVNQYLISFFDISLKGIPPEFVGESSHFPELIQIY